MEEDERPKSDYEKALDQADVEEEERQELVRAALAKFNFFIHITAWLSGCAFLIILGILVPNVWLWVLIPVGLWTFGLIYHGTWAFTQPHKSWKLWEK